MLFFIQRSKKVIQNRRLSLAVIIKRPSTIIIHHHHRLFTTTTLRRTPAPTHFATTVETDLDKNGFERIRSARFARVESPKRVARGPVGAMILRASTHFDAMMVVFFVLFARVIDPPPPFRSRESVRCVSRAKKKARKTARFRASRNRGKETERLFREREGESAFAYLFRDVCVLISDDDGFLVAMIFFPFSFFSKFFSSSSSFFPSSFFQRSNRPHNNNHPSESQKKTSRDETRRTKKKKTQTAGFEPTHALRIRFLVEPLNRSGTSATLNSGTLED